jgi:hypothetical protein
MSPPKMGDKSHERIIALVRAPPPQVTANVVRRVAE